MVETQTITVQSLAQEMSSAFERKKRDSGTEYVVLKDDSPEWMRDVCMASHGDEMLPDDWRYEFIEDAVDALEGFLKDHEDGDPQEADTYLQEYIYTYQQTGWLHSRVDRYGYCDDALEEFGGQAGSLSEALQRGMWMEQREVFGLVLSALEEEEVRGRSNG
ncbi:hypothetical protein LCGC14_2293320 [marine sediment metagenome]|uniref:Uncharacterized protein n=1 Tax=marine sediment metagenome TaxID=412755 RepID=A0A0F9CR30_9ZZZZ